MVRDQNVIASTIIAMVRVRLTYTYIVHLPYHTIPMYVRTGEHLSDGTESFERGEEANEHTFTVPETAQE